MSTTIDTTNLCELVLVQIRDEATGESGYFLGEPMLAMKYATGGPFRLGVEERHTIVPRETQIGVLVDTLRKLLPAA